MSEEGPVNRIQAIWPEEARAELQVIDRATALTILHCIDRSLGSRQGDLKHLRPPLKGLRLRCGDYRVFFEQTGKDAISILSVKHRSEAYR
ncbi:MAG: type II toxin-antitoxin system RelE/ParE family toxin [Terracidiphilus sp.]